MSRRAPILPLVGTSVRDQSNRDRAVARLSGELEFALTPSSSVFGEASYGRTRYDEPLTPTVPNRDSDNFSLIGGLNFDLAGRARGSLGVGYTYRDYQAQTYRAVRGLSAEARIELFPNTLTSIAGTARRVLEDSSLGGNIPFWDNRVSLRVYRELRRNIIADAGIEYSHQDYIGSTASNDVTQVSTGARYLLASRLELTGSVSYGHRATNFGNLGSAVGTGVRELRGQAGMVLQI